MEKLIQGFFTGERALYNSHNLEINDSTFDDGESPLKESDDIVLNNCIFRWKYPLWYCNNIVVNDTSWIDTARSGIWYTNNITINNSVIQAPKQFRRSSNITLNNVVFTNAEETLWNCKNVKINKGSAKGNYLLLNGENIEVNDFILDGNYAFDGAKNVVIRNSKLLSKDSFWNCDNVVVYDSTIIGEYLAWNSTNVTFVNCTIESLQGLCYMKNVKLVNCKLINVNLSFELCEDIDAEVINTIDSVKNPISGVIKANKINEIILDSSIIDPSKTTIEVNKDED